MSITATSGHLRLKNRVLLNKGRAFFSDVHRRFFIWKKPFLEMSTHHVLLSSFLEPLGKRIAHIYYGRSTRHSLSGTSKKPDISKKLFISDLLRPQKKTYSS